MTTDRAREAARLLVEAHRTKMPIVGLPPSCLPRDPDEAYAVQDAIAALRGPVRGWKVSPSEPRRCATVFVVEPSGVTLEAAGLPGLGVEVEFGFRIARDMPPRAMPYGEAEVFERLEFLPLIELIASRYIDKKSRSPLELMADGMTHGAFVVGKPIAAWRDLDFKRQPVTLAINDKVVQSAVGKPTKGNPADGIVWLANHVAGRSGGLRTGDVITTGALAGTTPAKAGDNAVGDWGPWGCVEVRFR